MVLYSMYVFMRHGTIWLWPERGKSDFRCCDRKKKFGENQVAYKTEAWKMKQKNRAYRMQWDGSLIFLEYVRLFSNSAMWAYSVLHVVHSGFMSLLCFKPKWKCSRRVLFPQQISPSLSSLLFPIYIYLGLMPMFCSALLLFHLLGIQRCLYT